MGAAMLSGASVASWAAIELEAVRLADAEPRTTLAMAAVVRYGRRANAVYLKDRRAWTCWVALCEQAMAEAVRLGGEGGDGDA